MCLGQKQGQGAFSPVHSLGAGHAVLSSGTKEHCETGRPAVTLGGGEAYSVPQGLELQEVREEKLGTLQTVGSFGLEKMC